MFYKLRQMAASVGGEFETVDAEKAAQMAEKPETFILDVRTPGEYADGHLKNSLLIPHTEVQANASKLPADKEKPILCYCAAGVRSAKACKVLNGLGYKKVFNLDGGINAWLEAGKPVAR